MPSFKSKKNIQNPYNDLKTHKNHPNEWPKTKHEVLLTAVISWEREQFRKTF